MVLAIIITLAVLLVVASYLAYVQTKKAIKLEEFCYLYVRMLSVMAVRTDNAYKRMKEVDRLGSFEADDETGFIFQEIKETAEELNDFVKKYINNDKDIGEETKKS
jgi:hypothetical protein